MKRMPRGEGVFPRFITSLPIFVCLTLLSTATIRAADVYFRVSLSELKLTEGTLPAENNMGDSRTWEMMPFLEPYAALDGAGEAYVGGASVPWQHGNIIPGRAICICAPEGRDVTGRLFLPKADYSGMVKVRFTIPATDATPGARDNFLTEKQQYYERLRDRNLPGAAWFRHQAASIATLRGTNASSATNFYHRYDPSEASELENTFELFSGGRALSENLQLDRTMPPANSKATNIEDITNLSGITVAPMDWKPFLAENRPALDPLAAYIPADQYAVFFPSFKSMTTMMDESDANGAPLLQSFEARSEDAGSRDRYEKQLCLKLDDLSRLLGPQAVASAALTGSDPFLRVGTDLAVLFESTNPQILKTSVMARQASAQAADPGVKAVSGEINSVPFAGVVSQDRSVSSYLASVSNVVFVSNSRKQLDNLVQTALGRTPALSSQDEYIYFRQKYPRGDANETAFLVLSDATIRRWCGPQWRIADSRRTRAAAVLSDLQAAHVDEIVRHQTAPAVLHSVYVVPDMGELKLTAVGVQSSTYGTPGFLTPISELPITTVTEEEAEAYGRWRDTYQENWHRFFDPIAMCFSVSPAKLGAEVTVMPLIAGSQYNEFTNFTIGAQIAPDAGDPHTNTLLRLALAVNAQSQAVQEAGNFVGNVAPGLKENFLAWLGQSITIYADDDPFWSDLQAATNAGDYLEQSYARLPVALYCEVKNSLGVAAFLTAIHAFAEQSAPKMINWENLEYHGQSYVKIAPNKLSTETGPGENWSVYYAVTPDSLTVTLSEALLKRALDRQALRASGKPGETAPMPWLGGNVCFQVDQKLIGILLKATQEQYQTHLKILAWNNIPILNEWKRRFPDRDPVKLHEQLWGVKLLCPAGGSYVWNDEWQTMESTDLGHPGDDKGANCIAPFTSWLSVNLGLTFENQGLSAKAVLNRSPAK